MATPVNALNSNAEFEKQLTQNAVEAVAGAAATQATAPAGTTGHNNDTVTISDAAQQAAATATPAAAQTPSPQPTYLQILSLSEQGLTLQQIAKQLGISLQAAETYLGPPPAGGSTTNTRA